MTVASASFDLSIAPGTKGVLGALRVAELKSADGSIATLSRDGRRRHGSRSTSW